MDVAVVIERYLSSALKSVLQFCATIKAELRDSLIKFIQTICILYVDLHMSLIHYIAQFINPAHAISSANRQIRMKRRFRITNKLIYINLANMRALRSAVISRGYTNFPFPMSALRGSAGCARAVVWMLNKAYNMIINQMWHIDFSFALARGRKREREAGCAWA